MCSPFSRLATTIPHHFRRLSYSKGNIYQRKVKMMILTMVMTDESLQKLLEMAVVAGGEIIFRKLEQIGLSGF